MIEAVFEDLELKRRVLAEVEAVAADELRRSRATPRRSRSATSRAAAGARSRVLGMHFFSPVHKMPLLEIVVTPETDAAAIATAVAFGRRVGQARDRGARRAGLLHQPRARRVHERGAPALLEEGAAVDALDAAMVGFGFPVGPVHAARRGGHRRGGAKVAGVMQRAFGERMAPPASMAALVADGRKGRKAGRGLLHLRRRQEARRRVGLRAAAGRAPRAGRSTRTETQERLVFAFLNESICCLQEGILRSPRDGDVGAIFGLGFPPFLGGPFRYLDRLGARFALETMEKLRAHGERFRPRRCSWTWPGRAVAFMPRDD